MVEYFGQQLGVLLYATDQLGCYSRCVQAARPLWRRVPKAANDRFMARLCTEPHPKTHEGMLTRPVTILCWSFVRDLNARGLPPAGAPPRRSARSGTGHGLKIIQIDEAALREGLPRGRMRRKNI